jgi:hypothetical protein
MQSQMKERDSKATPFGSEERGTRRVFDSFKIGGQACKPDAVKRGA